ncbi:protein phosphatase 1 regulatory subunit 36 isoform X1 [Pleurodeles waltl]|uniref:protein phosphatase 1 regulatory subunit 36 isoform X1 n=1 Tax=Pleurodeles waltl TaxID=8319 RepID=UPI0037094867
METITKPTPGRWYWKDDTKTLEFASHGPGADFREKTKKVKAIHFQEAGSIESRQFVNAASRSSPSIFRSLLSTRALDLTFLGRKQINKQLHKYITLDDVKYVALGLLEEHEIQHMVLFSAELRNQQLDDFLMALLYYLDCYLERMSLDKKPRSLMTNISQLEMKEMDDVLTRTGLAEKHFAHMYCILVLGVGNPELHHMACGRSKASTTQKDRNLYEALYNFCTAVAWVAFRRKDLDLIQEEVGRLLRSNAFNPALRLKDDLGENQTKLSFEKKKTINKRPAIRSIVNQRSPALISLMPSPKEKADYLFQQHQLHPNSTQRHTDSDRWMEMSDIFTSKVGIIGEPRRNFNPQTLIPHTADDDDDDDENKARKSNASFNSEHRGSAFDTGTRGGISRPGTVISRATTEGGYSDTEE